MSVMNLKLTSHGTAILRQILQMAEDKALEDGQNDICEFVTELSSECQEDAQDVDLDWDDASKLYQVLKVARKSATQSESEDILFFITHLQDRIENCADEAVEASVGEDGEIDMEVLVYEDEEDMAYNDEIKIERRAEKDLNKYYRGGWQ